MKRALQITSLLCFLPMAHIANAHTESDGYVYDERVLVRDNYGNCVRTAEWTEANALRECDPELFKQAVAAPPPAPVAAPAPPPPPVVAPVVVAPVVVPSPKPAPIKVDLSADESFDTNKADLKPAGKAKLSQFANDLRSLNYDKITITGHADRTGSKTGNQKLSEDRAAAARNYLISENVPAGKMESSGKGSTEPVTKAGDCAKMKGKKLQDCLAPDRRVELRVSGMRAQ